MKLSIIYDFYIIIINNWKRLLWVVVLLLFDFSTCILHFMKTVRVWIRLVMLYMACWSSLSLSLFTNESCYEFSSMFLRSTKLIQNLLLLVVPFLLILKLVSAIKGAADFLEFIIRPEGPRPMANWNWTSPLIWLDSHKMLFFFYFFYFFHVSFILDQILSIELIYLSNLFFSLSHNIRIRLFLLLYSLVTLLTLSEILIQMCMGLFENLPSHTELYFLGFSSFTPEFL